MKLTDKEITTVLAALRHWQDHTPQDYKEDWLHHNEHDPLTPEEIDDLCERINCGEPEHTSLVRQCIDVLNQIPNRKIDHPVFQDTYAFISYLERVAKWSQTKEVLVPEDHQKARDIVNTLPDDGDRIFMHRVVNKAFDEADLLPEPQDSPIPHTFQVQVRGCTEEQADQVMRERLGHDEDYGFPYVLNW